MDKTQKEHWLGLEDLYNDPEYLKLRENEFAEELPVAQEEPAKTNRRSFLKTMGYSIGSAALLAACTKAPDRFAVPYLSQPEEIVPGVANWYASSCAGCGAHCGTLVKTREGRPIKIEGNPESTLSQGGICAVGQSALLSLYDNDGRYKSPLDNKKKQSWDAMDKKIVAELNAVKASGKAIRIVSGTVSSPSTQKIINDFAAKYGAKHVMYDPLSYSELIKANQISFGKAVIPTYRFDQANYIIGFSADFLGTWLSPVQFTRQYVKTRNTERLVAYNNMSRHIQFESVLSLTGSNADVRIPVKPSDNGLAIAHLYNALSKKAGKAGVAGLTDLPKKLASKISSVADELWDHRGQSLVVCGVNHVECQVLVNAINSLIGSYGSTIDLDNPSRQRLGSDSNMISLVKEIAEDKVGAIIAYNANPAYDFPGFPVDKLKSMLSISLSSNMDETGDASRYICPDHNSLESWNIYEPVAGYVGISQPTIHPIFDTRSAQETLMRWGGLGNTSHYAYLKAFYTANYGGGAGKSWDQAVHDGFVQLKQAPAKAYNAGGDVNAASTALSNMASSAKGMELSVFQTVAIRDGKLANNPWLQELPDPISKATWDNFLAVSPEQAKKNGWEQGDIVELEVNGRKFKLPVLPQPGQAEGSVSAALGYGHTKMGKVANNVGQNLYPAVKAVDGRLSYDSPVTKISKTGDSHKIAQTQTYHSIRDDVFDRPRPIVKDTILSKYQRNPASGNQDYPALVSLWPERPEIKNSAYSWGMAIDLNSCTGCSGCIISCQAENNVAVVGKEEVANRREMHWIKIDRFYSGSPEAPEVTFLPMMCQHCDHAPCETVCPVLATTHTMDGLNHQAYNRCVGTRYCANNCPYKVRRFNWFEYSNNDKFDFNLNNSVGKLASNPDVVVRSRGVMEKCSMCIQRIQEAKLKAKKEGVQLKDGDIKMACEQSCPSQAIVFGNLKDPESKISRLFANKRKYHVIEEIKTLPSVGYLTRVRNKSSREI